MTFTPGPWEVAELHFDGYHIKQRGTFEIRTPKYDIATYNQTGGPFRKLADAQLAAAAPELLKRLKEARAAIASLPDDALGIVTAGAERYHWYIKDELLHYIDVELAKAESVQ